MKGCTTAIFMWLPILFTKTMKGLWLLISWILQTICGTPLYYCRPEYRIPAQIVGMIGLFFMFFFIMGIFIFLVDPAYLSKQSNSLFSLLLCGGIGFGLLMICRTMIKKGSI